jgi:Type II secretion system (T2SS), protein G
MKRLAVFVLIAVTSLPLLAASSYVPIDKERARWTMEDMSSWRIALAAYKVDHKQYPAVSAIEQLRAAIEGVYMIKAPTTDAWGRAYRYSVDATSGDYALVSSGADGVFQNVKDLAPGKTSSFDDDAVANGSAKFLFRSWEYR